MSQTIDPLAEALDRVAALEARLTARLDELEDERKIRELLAHYGYLADAGRDDEYLDLFTDDGVMDMAATNFDGYTAVFSGKDELAAFITDPAGHHTPGYYMQALHVQGNNVAVRIDGDEAVAGSYSIVLQKNGTGVDLIGAAVNEWRFRRVDGVWKIALRKRRPVGSDETYETLSATLT